MEYRLLGRTGLEVSPLCLGAMMFGAWGNPDHDESVRVIHRALDAGINFVDTADVYSAGESEEIVAKALAGRRDQIVLATGALTDLVRAGKVRYLGSSTFGAHEIVEAQWVAERRSRERFVCEQPPYSLLVRGIEREVLPVCAKYGLGVITWSPLAGGWLSGGYRKDRELPGSTRSHLLPLRYDLELPENRRKLDAAEALAVLAGESGLSLIHLAIAFTLRHPAVSSVIIGPRTMEQLESQLGAAEVELSTDVLDRIDEIVAPGTNLNPHDGGYVPPELAVAALRRR